MIEIRQLTVRYGNLTAVDTMSLSVPAGEILGLVGPNGAGKTTTMKVLAGLLLPDDGTVSIGGLDVVTRRLDVQRQIGYMVDFFGVYDYLTVAEYLEFFGGLYGVEQPGLDGQITAMLETAGLGHKRDSMVHELSRGMKQRLYFARTLIHRPRVLILDEPAAGLDPRGRIELMSELRALNASGTTIFISSHILDELADLCTSVAIMEKGRLVGIHGRIASGGPPSVAAPSRRVYLTVAGGDASRARAVLAAIPDVAAIEGDDDQLVLTVKDIDDAVSGVVVALVHGGVRVLLPPVRETGLRETFFRATRGETT